MYTTISAGALPHAERSGSYMVINAAPMASSNEFFQGLSRAQASV